MKTNVFTLAMMVGWLLAGGVKALAQGTTGMDSTVQFSIDAPFVPGGRLNVAPSGAVTIGTSTQTATVNVVGDFFVSGIKSALVRTASYGKRQLYAVESPESWFEDFGKAKLHDGQAIVQLDPIFAETVSTDNDYHIFMTPRGDCKGLYVAHQTNNSFEVRELQSGKAAIEFDYRIVAKRKGYEQTRLAQLNDAKDTQATQPKLVKVH